MPDFNTFGSAMGQFPQGQPNPGQMIMQPGGGTTGAPLQAPLDANGSMHALGGGHMPNVDAFHSAMDAYRTDRQDWRNARPDHTMGMDKTAWMQALSDWRGLRPDHPDPHALLFGAPTNTGIVPPAIPGAAPVNPAAVQNPSILPAPPVPTGGVGTSLGVIGATPASNPYGLPTY